MSKSKAEAATYLGVTERTLERYTKQGKLPAKYIRGKTKATPIYEEADLDKLKLGLSVEVIDSHQPETLLPDPPASNKLVKRNGAELQPSESINLGLFTETIAPFLAANKLLLSLAEAAAITGLSKQWLTTKIKSGELRAAKIGKGWKIKRSEVERFINALY